MAYLTKPVILDKKIIGDGLRTLFTSFASDLSADFSTPMLSGTDISTLCTSLSTYLKHFVNHDLRHSNQPLRPGNLDLQIMRTRNPEEEYFHKDEGEKGKYIKGEKKWYRVLLYETTITSPTTATKGKVKKKENRKDEIEVQILAEGELRLAKAEVLEGFEEAVKKRVEKWESEERERNLRVRKESRARRGSRKGKTETVEKGKTKAKKRVKREESEVEDLEIGEGDEESGHDGAEDGWGVDPDDEFDPMTYKAKKKPERERKAPRKSAMKGSSRSNDAQITVKKRRRESKEDDGDVYGYNSDSGEYEGIRVKKKGKKERVRFQDEELGNEEEV